MKVFLVILTLLGAIITTISSIWGSTNKLSEDGADGKKSLLPAGKVSIVFTIVGLTITFCSGIIGYRITIKEAEQKMLKEAIAKREAEEERRKREFAEILRENRLMLAQELQTSVLKAYNKYLVDEATLEAQRRELIFTKDIILSGQSVRSLSFSWNFSELDKSLHQLLAHLEQDATDYIDGAEDLFSGIYGPRHYERQALVRRYKQLYPFLKYLTGGSTELSSRNPILVVLSFDEQCSAVVSFGLLTEAIAKNSSDNELKEYGWSGAIEYEEDFEAFEHFDVPVPKTRQSTAPYLKKVSKNEYAINWNLDVASLYSALDLSSSYAFISSGLPERFRIMLFYDIDRLPFEQNNMAKPLDMMPSFWNHFTEFNKKRGESVLKKQTVSLSLNGEINTAIYDVFLTEDTDITESFDPPETYCRVKVFDCTKRELSKKK